MSNKKIIIFVICILFIGFVIIPIQRDVRNLQNTYMSLEKIMEKKNERLAELIKAKENIIEKDTPILKKIPLNLEQENVIRDIKKIAKNSGFDFSGLGFSKSYNEKVGANMLKISCSVKGPLHKAKELLETIENNERFFGMESLGIGTNSDNVPQVSFSISLYTFYQN